MQAKLCGSDSNLYLLSPFDDHIKRREQTQDLSAARRVIRIIADPEYLWRNCNLSKWANVKNQLQKFAVHSTVWKIGDLTPALTSPRISSLCTDYLEVPQPRGASHHKDKKGRRIAQRGRAPRKPTPGRPQVRPLLRLPSRRGTSPLSTDFHFFLQLFILEHRKGSV